MLLKAFGFGFLSEQIAREMNVAKFKKGSGGGGIGEPASVGDKRANGLISKL